MALAAMLCVQLGVAAVLDLELHLEAHAVRDGDDDVAAAVLDPHLVLPGELVGEVA